MKNLYFVVSLAIIHFCVSANAVAQQLSDTKISSNGSIYYSDLKDAKITNKNAIFTDLLKISSENSLNLERTYVDNVGIKHDYHQQYYKGIKVEGGNYTLHSKDNNYQHISGNFENIENLIVDVAITEKIALQKILSAVGAKEYAWQNAEAEKFIKDLKQNPKESYLPKAELLIVRNWDLFEKTGEIKHHLCYAFYIRATQPDLDLRVYIDAQTGEIIAQKNMVCYADGMADTRYSGRVAIKTEAIANGYRLRDTQNNIQTLNAMGYTQNLGYDFIDANNDWTAGEYNNAAKDNAALDAHFGATKVVQYWKNTHNRQSFDNTNTPLKQLVHAKTSDGANGTTENASWTQSEKVVRYGDGGNIYKPLTALDWVAHETGHAYSYGLGLDIVNPETSDLHEGLSDIWAMCIDRDDWLFGDQVQNNGKICTRSIENPTLSTAAFQGASTYLSPTYNAIPSYHPHGRGLVLAHWFYLLSEGKIGTNELNKGYFVEGIGKGAAEQIVYGMYPYLTNGWASVANAAKQSAKALYGACSPQYVSAVNALYAVNLDSQMISKPIIQFTAVSPVICNNSSFTFSASFSGATPNTLYRWVLPAINGVSFANGATYYESTSSSITVYVNQPSNFINVDYIPLTVSVACPNDNSSRVSSVYNFWAGKPLTPGVVVPNDTEFCYEKIYTLYSEGGQGIEDYVWETLTPNTILLTGQSGNSATFRVVGFGVATVRVKGKNRCNNFSEYEFRTYSAYVNGCYGEVICPPKIPCYLPYSLYPNPASSVVHIGFKTIPNQNLANYTENYSFKVYNNLGILQYEGTRAINSLETSFSVSTWADGIYTVLIQTERGIEALKLAVQKGNVSN
jgi:Zn-dependent metalloprotease